MVHAFALHLNRGLASQPLPADVQQTLRAGEIRLGGLEPPAGLNPTTSFTVRKLIGEAFVFAFRLVLLICAGLCLASAVIAKLMIPGHSEIHSSP